MSVPKCSSVAEMVIAAGNGGKLKCGAREGRGIDTTVIGNDEDDDDDQDNDDEDDDEDGCDER